MRPSVTAERLLKVALDAFRERGYAAVSPSDVAIAAGLPLDEVYRHFPRKESFVLRLYEQLASALEGRVAELPDGDMADRFRAIVRAKLELIGSHRDVLQFLLPAMLDPANRLGVLGPYGDRIRARVQGIFAAVVHGANDSPPSEQVGRATRMLYTMHLAIVFLTLQDQSADRRLAAEGLELAGELIALAGRFLIGSRPGIAGQMLASLAGLPRFDLLADRFDRLASAYVQPPHDPAHFTLAERLLRDLFRYRRLQPGAGGCGAEPCPQCLALHRPRVEACLAAGEPLHLVLPAFPAKSANVRKVTGALPDLGEELALRFLQERCDAIREIYSPGARLTICSDGRVFNDLVGVADDAVTAYRVRLIEMIGQLGLDAISVFDLDDVRPGEDFDATRRWLTEQYGEPTEVLIERIRQFEHHRQMFNGIHRFLFEDLVDRESALSRTQARNRSKDQAYEVIRRSNAWSRLIAVNFPEALRLSIHPQPPHAEKIGILLTPAEDLWLTPWHGVALLQADRFVLTRRAEAEKLGARLICRDGRPSHFEMPLAPEASHAH
jgi:pyoverdine/dityrosine biosynthesis protein Dit1/AcrR family transcriptional regulator